MLNKFEFNNHKKLNLKFNFEIFNINNWKIKIIKYRL